MKLACIFTVLACAVVAHSSTVANILADIAAIDTAVTSSNTLLNAYPLTGGTVAAALAIHNAGQTIGTTLTTAATDVTALTPLPLSVTDATSILNALDILVPKGVAGCSRTTVLKPAFAAIPIVGVIPLGKADLVSLNNKSTALADAVIAITPASLLTHANTLRTTILNAFIPAIAAYT